jgi:hypothetical protein
MVSAVPTRKIKVNISSSFYTQRQAQELISGPCLGAKAKLLSFNMTQFRAFAVLLPGQYPEETSSSNGAVRQSIV